MGGSFCGVGEFVYSISFGALNSQTLLHGLNVNNVSFVLFM